MPRNLLFASRRKRISSKRLLLSKRSHFLPHNIWPRDAKWTRSCIRVLQQIVTWSTNLLNVQWLRKSELPTLDDFNQFKFSWLVRTLIKMFLLPRHSIVYLWTVIGHVKITSTCCTARANSFHCATAASLNKCTNSMIWSHGLIANCKSLDCFSQRRSIDWRLFTTRFGVSFCVAHCQYFPRILIKDARRSGEEFEFY